MLVDSACYSSVSIPHTRRVADPRGKRTPACCPMLGNSWYASADGSLRACKYYILGTHWASNFQLVTCTPPPPSLHERLGRAVALGRAALSLIRPSSSCRAAQLHQPPHFICRISLAPPQGVVMGTFSPFSADVDHRRDKEANKRYWTNVFIG